MINSLVIRTFPVPEGDDIFLKIMNSFGVKVVEAPLIEVKAIDFSIPDPVLEFDWIIFTSKNALKPFLKKVSDIKNTKIAVIGNSTAEALKNIGYQADFIGSGHSGARFAEEFKELATSGDRVLLAVGKLASNVMENSLEQDFIVHRVDVYETTIPRNINLKAIAKIESDDYGYIAVSSPSAVDNLMLHMKNNKERLRFVSIGTVTSAQIRRYGIEPSGEATNQNYKGLAETIVSTINPQP
ncbi:uroporphyrinogen-III synthase [Alkalitalea saponilacus]|uniref:uroporphyrinogen-III synthase n=1 Tax=Alkalitalea saponilacus TaxID=889453 RepID=UPI0013564301|nr:uroporphyrinogen-III synthase [Alkalitalea saponilacus]